MAQAVNDFLQNNDWFFTTDGEPRGYIESQPLKELWFHTGTACNLSCPFCFEGASPGNNRIEALKLKDAKSFIDEALSLGVEKFSFTGGEPFVNPEIINILEYALKFKPCHVLTNATKPLLMRLNEVEYLQRMPNELSFRASLDFPNPKAHDANRGRGCFELTLKVLAQLHQMGLKIEVARHSLPDEDLEKANSEYYPFFYAVGLPDTTPIIAFSDLFRPGSCLDVPQITENCMTTYKNKEERAGFMCSYSKMIVKKNGVASVYACTLVDDDEAYDLGASLKTALGAKVMLRHHRCYSCFSVGTSCSASN